MTNRTEQPSRGTAQRVIAFAAFALLSLCLPGAASAQWTSPDAQGNISNTNTGGVGVGNSSPYPGFKLTVGNSTQKDGSIVIEGQDAGPHILFNTGGGNRGRITTLLNGLHLQAYSGSFLRNDIFIRDDGNVGIGTTTPGAKLDVVGNFNASGTTTSQIIYTKQFIVDGVHSGTHVHFNTGGYNIGRVTTLPNGLHLQAYSPDNWQRKDLFIRIDGNVGVGTTAPASKLHVAGDITVDGNINAKYQDVAEWVPSTQKLRAGTVVVLDQERANHVLASTASYDTAVAGVISARPGLTLGEVGEGKALVATTGRVKVKVDATRAAIKIGDLLVTSDVAGVAMRSEPVMVGGRKIHAPGTIIGKALEPLAGGTGEILVLLSLQ